MINQPSSDETERRKTEKSKIIRNRNINKENYHACLTQHTNNFYDFSPMAVWDITRRPSFVTSDLWNQFGNVQENIKMVSKKSIDQLVKELEEHRMEGACLMASGRSKYPAETTRVCQEIVVCIDELHQMKRRIEHLINHEFR